METSVVAKLPAKPTNSCLVAAVYQADKLPEATATVDKEGGGIIKRALKQGDLAAQLGSTLLISNADGLSTNRLLLVRAGKKGHQKEQDFLKIIRSSVAAVRNTGTAKAWSLLSNLTVSDRSDPWCCQQESLEAMNASYSFTEHNSLANPAKSNSKETLQSWSCINLESKTSRQAMKRSQHAVGISAGCDLARDLGNLAPNICTPSYLAKTAKSLQKISKKLKVSVLDEGQMKKLGMGALLSVSQGSNEPAKLISMEYRGAAATQAPVVLLGKGVTFDSGGISIKSSATLDEMKFDMCGAASVFGAMRACLELELKCNLICVVAAAENMPDGKASRPGDVVTSMSGQTIEILNTDAEGRMVMCDALTWIKKFKPAAVIDVATLTGSCVVALGNVSSALMSNNQRLADQILKASKESGDKSWQLPPFDEYDSQLDSNFADMANIGGPGAGAITAGCFLARYTKDYAWAHLDIAGIAWHGGKNKGATGRPVPLLMQFLIDNHT